MTRAVNAQIEFWELATSITEMTDADPDVVFELLRAIAITADTGPELGEVCLRQFLNCVRSGESEADGELIQ